ncbi:hypothetical protein NE865_13941 [Phthorimaea operculella]|nr:hypothetical protein NE865_13941 [Phthorimaea operculella]
MSRRDIVRGEYPLPPPSKCAKVLYYTWKLCSVVFSHFVMISLVVAYCILGAVTFEKLEAQYEREVKMNISQIRRNTTNSIWTMTNQRYVLMDTNWTKEAIYILKDFENAILLEMKVRGWDGNEDVERLQWTFTGALFYSIIVITTIVRYFTISEEVFDTRDPELCADVALAASQHRQLFIKRSFISENNS